MDDFIGLERKGSSFLRKKFLRLLWKLGLHISVEKSSLKLEQTKEFLGLNIDTQGKPMFFVPLRKKDRSCQGDHEIASKSKESFTSEKSCKSSRPVHLTIKSNRSDQIVDEASVLGFQEEEIMEWEHFTLPCGGPGLGVVEGHNGELGWEDSRPKQSGCDDLYRREQLRS